MILTCEELRLRWPFPRRLHAQAIDRLRRAGARTVVYDIQFAEPAETPTRMNDADGRIDKQEAAVEGPLVQGVPDPEMVARATRRRFSAQYKLGVLIEADAASAPCTNAHAMHSKNY